MYNQLKNEVIRPKLANTNMDVLLNARGDFKVLKYRL